jgi:glycosyltransferase involved in cell wall biosynthesis
LVSDCSIELIKIEPAVSENWLQKNKYSETAQALLCVGNYVAGKGHHQLIDVLSSLVHTEWTLQMYGNQLLDPDCFEAIVHKVKEHGLNDRIMLLPAVSHEEINRKMVESDLLVNLSQYESYSMVTAEAIASGLPVVSYRTGNVSGFIDSGLVRYIDDAPKSADSALEDLICNAEGYSQLRRTEKWQIRTWRDVGHEFSLLLGLN